MVKNPKGKDKKKEEEEKKIVPALDNLKAKDKKKLDALVTEYVDFLNIARTPVQVVDYVVEKAKAHGFADDQVFVNESRENVALVHYGSLDIDIEKGISILGAHVDSPCLHLKPNPIKEGEHGVRVDTQYYGGIWKHQWFDQQVKVVGHVVKNGVAIPIEFEGTILDTAPHLGRERNAQKVSDAFVAEELDVLTGYARKEDFLKDLGIEEKDFQRAALYVVPIEASRLLNNQDLIVGYGHDDRVCVFTQLMALLESNPGYPSIVFGVDREEIGSTGLTGAKSMFFERVLDQVISKKTQKGLGLLGDAYQRLVLSNSRMLSADVDIATTFKNKGQVDPDTNTKAGYGLAISTYCGSGGKYMGNQAPAWLMDELMTMFDEKNGIYQISGLPSKVDAGGGGTIAMYFAHRGIPTVDAGVPVAGMHSKTETVNKGDVYRAFECFKIFLERKVK